jgi:hypothetical protein
VFLFPQACKAFIGGLCDSSNPTLVDVLLKCPRPEVRRAFASLMDRALGVLARIEQPFMNEVETIVQPSQATASQESSSSDESASEESESKSGAPQMATVSRAISSRLVEYVVPHRRERDPLI